MFCIKCFSLIQFIDKEYGRNKQEYKLGVLKLEGGVEGFCKYYGGCQFE